MEANCANCGKLYRKPPSAMKRSRYCSRPCMSAARTLERISVPCGWCGKPATQDRRGRARNFCSKACASRHTAKTRSTTKGRYTTSKGYVAIYKPDHPSASKGGYVMEHRLVMEAMLGRLLLATEIVHHRNGNRAENERGNLEILTKIAHDKLPKKRQGTIHCPHCAAKIVLSRFARIVEPT